MNAKCYRTVYNAVRNMLIAVEECASSTGKGRNAGSRAGGAVAVAAASVARFTVLPVVFGAWCALGLPSALHAQVVAAPGSAAQVVQTQNGLQQVNVGRPNGAGVSLNTYTQFNVPTAGTILNNAPTITQTQQAGYINGNPNLLPGGSARIIVNQVTSTNVSTLNGYLEVAGPRTEVVISNPNGILVNGGGFINTSRATLTTGLPVFGGSGSLDAFRVTGGQISIQGAGLNAANVDQVDLIARAVQANAAVYANTLSVIAGAAQVDRNTLAAMPIAGDGVAPALGIDVSQLGGMYANKILLASTENGVGVSLKGVTAAQAGDLTLTSQGKLILAGQTNATGNLSVSSAGGIDNTGTTYGQQSVSVSTSGDLTNSGTLAAQQGLSVNAGNVASTGTLGAGINSDGSIAHSGDLSVVASGALSATGQNAAGGNATLQGGSVNLAGSQTTANGNLGLAATAGNLNLTGATTSAGAALNATAQGALVNDGGHLSSQGPATLTAGSLSNQGGQIVSQSTLSANVTGAAANQNGVMQAAGVLTANAGSLDNTGGHIASLNADGLNLTAGGLLNNGAGGAIGGNGNVTVQAGQLSNAGNISAVQNLGVNATQALTNTGTLAANGNASVVGGSVDNSGGTVAAGGATTVQSGSTFTNTAGLVQGNSSVAVTVAGAVSNTGGQIEANSTSATLQVSGASIDNTNGRIANIGTGATTINAASIANANPSGAAGAGTIGGNGDVTLTGQTLSNTQGAQIVAGHDLNLNVSQSVDNSGGTLSGANNLTMNQSGAALTNQNGSIHGNGAITLNVASLDNTAGKIGNDTGSGGSVAITSGTLSNQGGAIGSDQNLSITTNQLSGDGKIIAGNDGTVTVNGDYTNTAANQIQGNHNLTLTTTGNFTNQGTLTAVNALNVNAANVDNQAGADLNSASTTVHASNAITNAGRLEGDTVTTQSATLANTGTVVGNVVTLNAGSISNTGASAAIAAATQLNLYASNSLSNTGGAEIYSVGDINIAADGTRDANGLLANRTGVVNNDQSTIAAEGNLEVAAQTLNNTRPAPTVQTVTTDVSSVHETKRSRYIACATMNADPNGGCSQAIWTNEYKNPTTSTYASSQIVSQTSGANPVDNVIVVNVNGQNQTIYYNGVTNNGDGTVNVTYWAGYDPHTNYVPSSEYTTRSDAHNGYQRVEIARDTTTTTQQDQVTSSAPQARLLAGRNMILANVGTINNSYSAIAAGGSIQIGSSSQSGSVGSGSYGGTTVNNTGQTLYQHQNQNIVSTYAWNENPSQDVGTVVQAPVVLSPVAIGGTGGTIVANNAVSINATSVNNTNVAAANSATGATGGTLGAGGAHQPTVNAPQSVAGGNGALSITLPTSGLYSLHPAPGQPYLIVSDPRLTSYTKFISSDYMLGQLGLNPAAVQKRLGDGFYEEKLVRDQVTQLTGRVYLQGYNNNEDEYRALMASGVNAAKQFSLVPGIALTPAQMDALTSDIVWLVSQTVTLPDGSKQQVLAPVVYLAHTHANDLQPTGALIAADNVEIHAVGSAVNSGVIKGGTQTVVTATDIVNRAGSIGSDKTNGTTLVQATRDIVNASGEITGNRVAVLAGHDLINTTLVDTVQASSGNSKVSTTLLGRQGTIAATGDLLAQAGNDLTVHGASISAGGNAQVAAGHDLLVDTVQATTAQSVTQNSQHHWEASSTTHQVGTLAAGGNLVAVSGNDATFKGAQVSAGQDLSVIAGGNLTATTVTNTAKYDNVAADSKTRQEIEHTYDETVVGTAFSAGGNATLAAVNASAGGNRRTDGKGNVTLTGSSITAGTAQQDSAAATDGRPAASDRMTTGDQNLPHVSYGDGRQTTTDATASGRMTIQPVDPNAPATSKRSAPAAGSGSSGGAITIVADGDVTIAEARERHDSERFVSSARNGFLSSRSSHEADAVHTDTGNGSTVSGNTVHMQAGHDMTVRNSAVAGTGDVSLEAGNNVLITAGQNTRDESHSFEQKQSGLGGTGGIGISYSRNSAQGNSEYHAVTQSDARSTVGSTSGNVAVSAGKDTAIVGSDIVAGSTTGSTGAIDVRAQNIRIDAGQDWVQSSASQQTSSSGISIGIVGTPLDTLRNMRDIQRNSSKVTRAQQTLNEIGAGAMDTPQVAVNFGSSHSSSQSSSSSLTHSASQLTASGDIRLRATGDGSTDATGRANNGDITITGSTLSAGGAAALDAQRNVVLQASTDTHQESNSATSSGWHYSTAAPSWGDLGRFVGGGPNNSGVSMSPYGTARSADNLSGDSTSQNASVILGKTVQVQSRTGNIDVVGSGISALSSVDLLAKQGKIDIVAGTDTSNRHEDHSSRQLGDLGGTGTSGTVGVRNTSSTLDTGKTQQSTIRSQVASTAGDVNIVARDDVTVKGADLSAGGDLKLTGRNLNLDAGQDTERRRETQSSSQYGVTLAFSGYAVSIAQSVEQAARAVEQHKDPRVAALYGVQAGLMAYNASGVGNSQTGVGESNVPGAQTQSQAQSTSAAIKATVSIGGGSQQSESNASAVGNKGSTLKAGQNVVLTATGQDATGAVVDGDITARGTSIVGQNVTLNAARDINLESRQDITHQDSKSSGSNASIGVGFGIGGSQNGFTIELAAGGNRAHANGDSVTQVNTTVTAADTLTMHAGRDANLRGAQANGNTVNATVGRDLNIESRQDTDNYNSRSESMGAQVSLCVPPFCYGSMVSASANLSEGKTDSTYASVNQQSGIVAGSGGYNVNVKGNTDLVGGVISSTADPSKNTLTTGTLTTRDIENHANFSSSQDSFSASYSSANPMAANNPTALQQAVNSAAATAVGNAQRPLEGEASGTTRSAVSAGTVTITDNAGQQTKTGKDADTTVASLNRDTEHANGSIGKIFDKQKVEDQQELARLQAQVVQQAAPLLYNKVGDFLQGKPDAVKVAVHALVGGLVSRALGGEFGAGAAGAGAAELAMVSFGKQLLAIDGLSEGDRKALAQLVGMAVSGVAAGAAGGSAAGVAAAVGTAQTAVQNNYLKHAEIEELEKAKQGCFAGNANACDEKKRLEQLDRQRDAALAACVGNTSTQCNGLRQEVRSAEAEIIRSAPAILSVDYMLESSHTKDEANSTLSSTARLGGMVSGYTHTVVDGLASLVKGAGTLIDAGLGNDTEAQQSVRNVANGVVTLLSSPSTWGTLLANADKAHREELASAYERGDAEAVGRIGGELLANLPTGGGMGSIKNVGKVVEEGAAAAKAAEEAAAAAKAAREAALVQQQQKRFNEIADIFDKSKPNDTLTIGGKNIQATPVGSPGGSNLSGTTKVFDSQSLTDQEIRDFAQQLAGDVPLRQVAPNVYNAKLTDGTIINLRSISSSQAATGARWTIDFIGNSSVSAVTKGKPVEMKFR